jgi:hypothetical protein
VVSNPIGTVNVLEDAPDRLIELYPGVFDYAGTDPLTFLVTQNNNPSLVEATDQRHHPASEVPAGPEWNRQDQCHGF